MRANLANRQYRTFLIRYLLRAQANRCFYCDCWLAKPPDPIPRDEVAPQPMGCQSNQATFDHMLPISRGGDDRLDNLNLSCMTCNLAKANRTAAEFFAFLQGR